MNGPTILTIAALLALFPAGLLPLRGGGRSAVFWMLLGVALAGPLAWLSVLFSDGWRTDLGAALVITIAASVLLFAVLAALTRSAWRLAPLLMAYLLALGLMAALVQGLPGRPMVGTAPTAWIELHILFAVATYALVTIAGIAGLAVLLQERALRRKKPSVLTDRLPAVAEAEDIQVRVLWVSAVVLGLGLITGMATQYYETGTVMTFVHKTLLSLLAFGVLVILLVVHHRTGLRGRRAARAVLLAWLLLTLGYPGVKFVTDVLLA